MANQIPAPTPPQQVPAKGLALSALILGLGALLSIVLFMFTETGPAFLSIASILGLVGLILGIVALKKRQPKAMAITGIVTGTIALLLSLGIIVFALLFIGALMTGI